MKKALPLIFMTLAAYSFHTSGYSDSCVEENFADTLSTAKYSVAQEFYRLLEYARGDKQVAENWRRNEITKECHRILSLNKNQSLLLDFAKFLVDREEIALFKSFVSQFKNQMELSLNSKNSLNLLQYLHENGLNNLYSWLTCHLHF